MDPGHGLAEKAEKDIFEDTDFEVDALDPASDDRTVQLEAASDFDLEEGDSASEVFALDEDDVDQNAATAMGARRSPTTRSGEFDDRRRVGRGRPAAWDVESDGRPAAVRRRPAVAVAGSSPPGPRPSGAGSGSACSGVTSVLILPRRSSRWTWSATSTNSRATARPRA